MAGNTTTITLKLKQEGLDDVVRSSKAVSDFFASAASSAQATVNASRNIKTPSGSSSGGSRAMSNAEAQAESGSYGVARSAVGTGASARDFAQQAQGLGGLVRLYATFAANVFAVGAAFTALSKAADLQNMIKGLDQLGASSGKSLGGLAKQVSVVSDGMLSLKDSIQAVAQASSAGLSTKQIVQMTEVAKKASIALGRDMGDSITRITKGISKLEPELLDELGIMTRVDKATQEYARTVGKTTAELTQFEKQQAFANAVLKEGLDKFSSIDIQGNSYQKLLASFQNLSAAGLNLVNKVLGPIAEYLANSPTALATAMGAITALLVSKAIPSITHWREGLKKAAQQAADTADQFTKSFGDEWQAKLEQRFKIPDLEAKLAATTKAANTAAKAIAALPAESRLGKTASVTNLQAAQGEALNAKLISNVNNLLKKRLEIIEQAGQADSKVSTQKLELAKQEAAYLDKLLTAKKAELVVVKELDAANRGAQELADKKLSYFDQENIALRKAAALRQKATQYEIVSNAATNASIVGLRGAWTLLSQEVADKGVKGFEKFTTLAKGGLAAVGTRIASILGSLSNFAMYIGIAVAAFQVLDGIFSKATKQAADFDNALEVMHASIDNAGKTLQEFYSPKGVSAEKALKGITAIANAFEDLVNSATTAVDSLANLRREMNGWDKGIDFVKSIFGNGTAKLQTDLAKNIRKSLELAASSGLNTDLTAKLQDALGIKDLSLDSLKRALSDLPTEKLEKIKLIGDDINKVIRENEQRFVGLNGRIEQATKHFQEFSNSLLPSDTVGKIGNDILAIGVQLEKLMAAPVDQAVAELASISKDANKLIGLDPSDALKLVKYSQSLNDLVEGRKQLLSAGQAQDEKIIKTTKELKEVSSEFGESRNEFLIQAIQEDLSTLKEGKKLIITALSSVDTQISSSQQDFLGKYSTLVPQALARGATLIANSISTAMEKAKLSLAKVELAGPSGVGDAKRAADLAIKELDLQQRQIDVQLELIDSQTKLADAITKSAAEATLARAPAGSEAATNAQTVIDKLNIKEQLRNKTALELSSIIKDNTDNLSLQIAAQDQLQDAQKKEALIAQSIGIAAQKRSEQIKAQQGSLQEIASRTERIAQLELSILTAKQESNNILSSAVGYSTKETANAQELYNLAVLRNKQEKELRDIDLSIAQLRVVNQDDTTRSKIKDLEIQRGNVLIAQVQELNNLELKGNLAIAAAVAARQNSEIDFATRLTTLRSESTLNELNEREAILNILKQQNQVSDTYVANKTAEISLDKLRVDYATKLRDIEAQRTKEQNDISGKIGAVNSSTDSNIDRAASLAELNTQEERSAALFAQNKKNLDAYYDSTVKIIGVTKATSLETAKYNKTLEELQTISEALADIFGDLGKSMGEGLQKGLSSFKKFTDKQERINKDYAKDKEKRDTETAKNQLELYADEAGAAKQMFSEKTAAYKVFAGIEKAMHAARLAMWVVETAASLEATATRIGATVAEASVDGIAGVVKAISSMPFPANIAAGVATAAIMAALIGSIGGKGPQMSSVGLTAKDMQETQGTGTAWKDGKKVETGGGVFGDASAKSESIANSLEIIKDTSVDGLQTNNKMLEALKGIKDAIAGTAQALYSLPGVRTGSAFGTADKTSKTSGITGLWGKTSTKDLIDSGIKISGMFTDITKGMSGTVKQYETIQETIKKSGFLGIGSSTSTNIIQNVKNADSAITAAVAEVFQHATDLFKDVGSKIGLSSEYIINKLSTFAIDVPASLKGLTGADLEKEFYAVISNILDDTSNKLFSDLKKYQKFGEGMLETVVRVADTNDKIKLSFDSIGKTYTSLGFDVTEALANASEGLSEFLDKVSSYKDTFLSDAEKLAPIKNSVNSTLTGLADSIKNLTGQSVPQTREQFKSIINAIDVTTESGRALFTQLINISDAFGQVTEEHQQLLEEYSSLEDKLLETFRGNAKVKEAIDYKATKNMDAVTKAQYEQNRVLEKQIDVLGEYYDLMDELDSVTLTSVQLREKERSAVADSNKTLYDYVNAQKDLKSASENAKSQLQTINSEMNSLNSAAQQAASALSSAAQAIIGGLTAAKTAVTQAAANVTTAVNSLVQGFITAQNNLVSAKNALQNALNQISQGYVGALQTQQAAQKAIIDKVQAAQQAYGDAQAQVAGIAKQATKSLQNFSKSLKEFIKTTATSDLGVTSGPTRIKLLQAQFNDLLNKALTGDTDAQGQLTGIANQLLTAGKEQASSAVEYATLYSQVLGTLDSVSNTIDQTVGISNDLADESNAAAAALAKASYELDKWTEVAKQANISLQDLASDPAKEYKDALGTYKDATDQLAKWNQLLRDVNANPYWDNDPTIIARKAFDDAATSVAGATKELDDWTAALKTAGLSPNSTTQTAAQQALEGYKKALDDQVDAINTLNNWNSLIAKYNFDVEASTQSSSDTLTKYFDDWTKAKKDSDTANSNLQKGVDLLNSNGITWNKNSVDALSNLKTAVDAFNLAQTTINNSNAIIAATKLDDIKVAIETMATTVSNAVLSTAVPAAVLSAATTTVKIPETGMGTGPTTKMAEAITGTVGSASSANDTYYRGRYRLINGVLTDIIDNGGVASYDEGTKYVPRDGLAFIHEGEKITPAKYNANVDESILQELQSLRTLVTQLTQTASLNEVNTRKTKDILTNVTQGGTAMQTQAA